MTPDEEVRRASEAQQITGAPLFVAAKADLYEQLAHLRRNVPIGQGEMHTKLIMMEQIADRFFGYFDQLAQTGKMARMHLEDEEKRRESFMSRILTFKRDGRGGL